MSGNMNTETRLYAVRYRFQGQIFCTVVTACSPELARSRFIRENPGVEFVEVVP